MGNLSSTFLKSLGLAKDPIKILTFGLDSAGKTTVLYYLKLGEVVTTIPTIGFNVETVVFHKLELNVWDLGGRDKIRPLFRHYFPKTTAVVFVIDCNDRERLNQAQEELNNLFKEDELRDCVFLVLANKQDLEDAMKAEELSSTLNLNQFKDKKWQIYGTSAIKGEGLNEAFDWLAINIKYNKNELTEPFTETLNDLSNWFYKLLGF